MEKKYMKPEMDIISMEIESPVLNGSKTIETNSDLFFDEEDLA